MLKLHLFFNVVCLYLAIKSALSAEVPDPNEQKISNYLSPGSGGSSDDGEVGKRASAMWFGPRLGKRTIPAELPDELAEDLDANPLFYAGEPPHQLATELAQGSPYVVLLVTGRLVKPPPPLVHHPVFFPSTTPRLGRRDSSPNENHSRPPFAPRLGRNLPFSPRLGRSFSVGGAAFDGFGY